MLLTKSRMLAATGTGGLVEKAADDIVPKAVWNHESEQENDRKRPRLGSPRVLKNDIRRHYCKMFLNTINSADIFNMQDFFNTFMVGNCKFVADQKFSPEFLFPDRLSTNGPRLAAHYVLGVFLMLPDLVVKLVDSQIITSNAWSGSKIQLQVQIVCTKVCDIPMKAWIPDQQFLDKVYEQHSLKSVLKVADMVRQTASSSEPVDPEDCTKNTEVDTHLTDQNATYQQRIQLTNSADDVDQPVNVHEYCLKTGINEEGAETLSSAAFAQAYIPYSYIRTLSNEATPLAQPLYSQNFGTITFYLDSNNHIQHMYMNLAPL